MSAIIPEIQPPLPEEEWLLARRAMECAAETRGDDTLMATMTCYGDDGGIEVYAFPDLNEEIKMAAMAVIKAKKKWTCCVFISEAWLGTMKRDDPYIRPRDDPNHEECLFCILYTDKYHIMWSLPIENNAVGYAWELQADERDGWNMGGKLLV